MATACALDEVAEISRAYAAKISNLKVQHAIQVQNLQAQVDELRQRVEHLESVPEGSDSFNA